MRATPEARIYDAGGHFVLCAPSKRPIWRGWNRLRPTADVAALHRADDGPVGIVPWSLHSTALDVDHGDPRALLEQFAAWADLPSRRGRHAYYDDDTPRANATWAALGCRGDIRGAKGYLVLHEDGSARTGSHGRDGECTGVFPRTWSRGRELAIRMTSRACAILPTIHRCTSDTRASPTNTVRLWPHRLEVVRTLLPEAQEPCRVHTTPISLGIPTRRRYGIRP